MRKYSILSFLLLAIVNVFGQTSDSVITNGGVDDVYYSFSNDEVARVSRTTWDIGFTMAAREASIMINENAGAELYYYSDDTTQWNSVDTTGSMWGIYYNSETSWSLGAFSNAGTSHPDYGWGRYNSSTHDINGTTIFILKRPDGSYCQVVIDKMSAAGVFTYRIADLGGANTKTYTLDKSNAAYKSKNFALVNSLNGNVVADNPDGDKWDLLFTKYTSFVQAGPNLLPYSLAGVKINKGCEVAERTGVATSSNDTSTLVWNTDITEIGADWKMYNGGTMAYDITADQTYFVRTQTGAVFKIYFTKYEGSTIGGFYFTYEKIASGASVNIVTSLNTKVYPNPASSELFVQNNESSVLSFELLATNGQTVLSQTINAFGKSAVNITDLTKGLYIARLSTSSGVKTERILID